MGPSLVLDETVSYKKTLDFSSTHYHFVIVEDVVDVISAHLVALPAKKEFVFLF
jgi:hypothetical protein